MKELSLLQKLDLVLITIEKNSHPLNSSPYISHRDLLNILTDNGNNNAYLLDFDLIIEKLLADHYIKYHQLNELTTKEEGQRIQSYSAYSIKFEGRIWNEQGGYGGQAKRLSDESIRVEKLEISQQKLMGRLNVLTGWIAGGTIALVLVELWRMALEHHWFDCH